MISYKENTVSFKKMHHNTGLRMHKTVAYLYFGYKPLRRQLDLFCLVSCGDFFMADIVIPTLTAHKHVLTTILGMSLNLLKDVIIIDAAASTVLGCSCC
jgi:hypothetical protein